MRLEFGAQEISVWGAPSERWAKRRSELTCQVRAVIGREFASTATGHRQTAQGGKGLHHRRFSGAVLANEKRDSGLECQVESTYKRKVERIIIRWDSLLLEAHAQ